jgi:hypothetical protein
MFQRGLFLLGISLGPCSASCALTTGSANIEVPPGGPNSVLFLPALNVKGEYRAKLVKPGGAALEYGYANIDDDDPILSGSDYRRFHGEDELPDYLDVTWTTENVDIVPDRRRFSARVSIRTRVPPAAVAEIAAARKGRGLVWYQLDFNLLLAESGVEVTWVRKSMRDSLNPLEHTLHAMNPTGTPRVIKVVDRGGPWIEPVQVQGRRPQLTDAERQAIDRKNKTTSEMMARAAVSELKAADLAWIQAALTNGADVDGVSEYVRRRGVSGRVNFTLLMLAAGSAPPEVLRALLKNGADVHVRNVHGSTALHYAALAGMAENVKLLLTRGADPNATNKKGETPLRQAELQGFTDVVAVLKAAGAK